MKLPKHIPQLDVLRGLAVLDVMLYHASEVAPSLHLNSVFRFGYTGVDLFFVLSGFLITGILVRSKDSPNYFSNFYVRRVLRIWPIYYVLILFTFGLLPLIQPNLTATIFERCHPWQAFLFFLQNFTAHSQTSFETVRVTWSLAIEEQFYLVWPLIIWLAPRKNVKAVALSAVFFSMAMRWSAISGLIPALNVYTNTLTRLDGLGLGAFLALWIPETDARQVKRAGIAALIVFFPITLAVMRVNYGHWSAYTLVSLCFAALLCVAINWERLANLAFLKFTGKISYCLYLIHVPILELARTGLRNRVFERHLVLAQSLMFVAAFALCYGIAAASWRFFESKFLRLKSKFQEPSRTAQLVPEQQQS